MENGAAMKLSLKAGKPVPVIEEPSLADSLGGGIGLDNQYTFQLVRDLVDETILVSEDEIAQAMRYIFETQRLVVQGGATVGVATLMAKKIEVKGKNVALVYRGSIGYLETVRQVLEGVGRCWKAKTENCERQSIDYCCGKVR